MDNIKYNEIKDALKKLTNVLLLDALAEKSIEKIALSNTLGIALSCIDAGPEMVEELMKGLGVVSDKLAEAISNGAPGTEHLSALPIDELMDDDGNMHPEALFDRSKHVQRTNLEDVLKDSGVHIQPEQNN